MLHSVDFYRFWTEDPRFSTFPIIEFPLSSADSFNSFPPLISSIPSATADSIQQVEKEFSFRTYRAPLAEGYSLIAASGGDGTVSKAGAALVGTEIPLAIIPTGTANVFAQDLGIPRNVRKSVELIFKEHSFRTVDMMRIWGKYYLLNMGVGLNALMIEDTDHKKKSALGLLAYVITGIKKAFGYQPHTFHLEVDGRKEEIDAAEVLVFNSSALGTLAIHLHRETLVDDGLLDLCILQSRNLWDYIKIFISIFLNRVKYDPKIHHFPVEKDVFIRTEKELKVQADGDLIGTTPVGIEVVPRILKIIIPAQ